MSSKQERTRLFVFLSITAFITLLIMGRFAWIMLGPKTENTAISTPNLNVHRGEILDRNGRVLAIQTQLYSVTAWIPHIKDQKMTSTVLGEILEMEPRDLYKEFSNRNRSRFMYIKRKITPSESDKLKTLLKEGKLPGISMVPEPGRSYPERNLASHIIGYVGLDNVGLDGLEYTYNRILAPPDTRESRGPIPGNRVYLTIDINTQYMVRQIAEKAYLTHKPDSIMIMVMDAKNGDLLSYISLPDFDPNHYQKADIIQRLNSPVVKTYEPGSVFKIFSIASIMDLGGIIPADTFDTSGGYNPELFQKYEIPPITDLGNYGVIDVENILIHSSNVGSAFASETVEAEDFYNKLQSFGFGQKTGIPLPGESNGILADTNRWSIRSKPTIAIGQEIGISAIQMISAATVFTNDGLLLKPHVVKKVESPEGVILKEYKREPLRQVISAKTARTILNMMEKVVSDPGGTVWRAKIPGLKISAKSGTAQVVDKDTGLYSQDNYVASVMGIFPTENPELIVYVVFETPKGDSYYGGRIAAPVLKEIIQTLAPYYHIPMEGNTVITHPGSVSLPTNVQAEVGNTIPDFTGYSKRQLLPLLHDDRFTVFIQGEGWVYKQDPPAGTPAVPGMHLRLELK